MTRRLGLVLVALLTLAIGVRADLPPPDVGYWIMHWNLGGDHGTGPTEFPFWHFGAIDPAYRVAAVGDIDGDSKADLIWRHSTTGALVVWLMNGFAPPAGDERKDRITLPTVDIAWRLVGAADFNGDGTADLFWDNRATNQSVIWTMHLGAIQTAQFVNGAMEFQPVAPGVPGLVITAFGDLNGDGIADAVWDRP